MNTRKHGLIGLNFKIKSTLNEGLSQVIWFDFIYCVYRHFQQYFSYIMATSFSGGGNRSTRREPPTMGKQLVNFITCGCESSVPFFIIHNAGREPTPYWW